MNDHALYDDYYSYTPLDEWKEVCNAYASRVKAPQGERHRPVYEILKQISTSCMSVDFRPSIEGDTVYFSTRPVQSDPTRQLRAGISPENAGQVRVHLIAPGHTGGRSVVYSRETAFPLLNTVFNRMGACQGSPDVVLPEESVSMPKPAPVELTPLQRVARRVSGLRSRFSRSAA